MPMTVVTGRMTSYNTDNVAGGNGHGGACMYPPSSHCCFLITKHAGDSLAM